MLVKGKAKPNHNLIDFTKKVIYTSARSYVRTLIWDTEQMLKMKKAKRILSKLVR